MHKSFIPKRYVQENKHSSIDDLLFEFQNELEFQKKVHLHTLSLLTVPEKESYISKIQNEHVFNLFGHNNTIVENFEQNFKNIIYESISSFSEHIDRLNEFLMNSLIFDIEVINEAWWNPLDVAKYAWNKTKQAGSYIYNKVSSAVNYIKEKGLGAVFESLRSALMSGIGTAIQMALSFTGVGAIANEIAWAIMTLYDAYQFFVNNAEGSMANLIIDLICLVTAGNLGKVLKGFVNTAGKTMGSIISKFMQSGVGKFLSPVIQTIKGGATYVANFLSSASKFMAEKMGINWVAGILGKVQGFFTKLAESLGSAVGGAIAKGFVRAGVTLSAKFEVSIFNEMAKISEQQLAKIIGKTVSQSQIKAADKYATQYLRDKPIQESLNALDKYFGTKIGDAYALYYDAKKLASHQGKISKGVEAVDFGTDALRGSLTTNKTEKYAGKIQKDVGRLGLN